MARDPNMLAITTTFKASGTNAGMVSNTLYLKWSGSGSPTSTDWGNAVGLMQNVYTFSGSTGLPLSYYLSPCINAGTNQAESAVYQLDLADPHHLFGSPVHAEPWTLGPLSTSHPLPNEVAAVLSYRTAYATDPEHAGSTRPRASDRGRFYLGPLNTNSTAEITAADGTKYANLATNLKTGLLDAASNLFSTASVAHFTWCVLSRKEGLLKSVAYCAADTFTDSQRRRSLSNPLQTWQTL